MHRHATVSAWQRDHDGSYRAELHGWQLVVRWHPEPGPSSAHARRGFHWEALQPALDKRAKGAEIHEEIEEAMSEAEAFAEESSGVHAREHG